MKLERKGYKMNIYVNVKAIGKRKNVFEKVPYQLPKNISTLKDLITEFVKIEVEKFNNHPGDVQLLPFLTETEIADKAVIGKIDFGNRYNDKKADFKKAVEVALQGFEDGLFKVIIEDSGGNKTETKTIEKLEQAVVLNENDTITFIRLTFLAGRRW
jgi:hypothetical protein